MEDNLPGTSCDRYSGGDDDVTPKDDDAVDPDTDDNVAPSDDSLPDDFWTCLQKSDSNACAAADCTWCVSNKYGFGLCMTGPTADSASNSDFFQCSATSDLGSSPDQEIEDDSATDISCLEAYLEESSKEACLEASDSQGNDCEYCDFFGMGKLCLNAHQAQMSSGVGVSCEEEETTVVSLLRGVISTAKTIEDPLDTACVLSFLQDPTEEGCKNAVDSDGETCEFCSYQGVDLCLNQEQAEAGEQFGMECEDSFNKVNVKVNVNDDPYDPTCALTFLENPTPDTCTSAVDEDGNPCKYCALQGALNLCLTEEQAEVGQSLGIECQDGKEAAVAVAVGDPLDTSCLMAVLNGGGVITPEDCEATVDSNGDACEFCSLPGIMDSMCLNEEQAQLIALISSDAQCGQQAIDLVAVSDDGDDVQDPYDPSCLLAYLASPTPDACKSAMDQDGQPCEYCTLQDSLNLCLNADQAGMGAAMGIECDVSQDEEEELEDSLFVSADVSDPSCLMAQLNKGGQMLPEECTSTVDEDGDACEMCTMQGIPTPLCLTDMQAQVAAQFGGECGSAVVAAAAMEEKKKNDVALPPDFLDCLKNYDQDDCDTSGCTWCDTGVGVGMCMADPAARAMSECDFFSCDTRSASASAAAANKKGKTVVLELATKAENNNPIDPSCMAAGMGSDDAHSVCNDTMDSSGSKACVW
eukprot:CAMPEP_0198144176 /NCGR_PEP_ID=MMETSP1443-20131203/13748_1 /TAXON_ID=186043 /ORGANISM="Entomoneis sp., Strain CCMP2396" /LENGTH=695 /DNA_ID=CAMNT_0043807529 /DNA_START=293 /DNA_END=2377 /DNA_ORIENTATION=+